MGAFRESKGVMLIVEDEPLVRMVAADIVQDAGFETIEVADADSAIGILEARKDIRIVFTDVNMPGSMGRFGRETFRNGACSYPSHIP